MNYKKLLFSSFCLLSTLNGVAVTSQVDGVTGATEVAAPQSKKATTPAKQLMKRLQKLQAKGIMLGHQDDPVYGTTWKWEQGKSDVLLTTGDYPAVMGFDLGKLELNSDKNLDDVPFDRMRQEIINQFSRGGIVTLSWHPWNPVTGENAWDPKGDAVKAVIEGGAQEERFNQWLSKVSNFINSLKTKDGKKVPVIFRPWHEMNGGWFWWGANSCTPAEYAKLYAKTYHTLTNAGCDNIVWAWSPNLSDQKTLDAFMERFPEASQVDLIGVDVYEFDNNDTNYQNNLRETLDIMMQAVQKTGKMAALTETGCRGISQKTNWFTQTLWPVLKDYKLSYVLFWRNAWDKPQEEAYLPGVNDGAIVKDFKQFYQVKQVLFSKDAKKVK